MSNPGSGQVNSHREDLGYPSNVDGHLTEKEASCILHTEAREKIHRFVQAMNLQKPVSDDDAATLLMNIAKHMLPPGSEEMAIQMRVNNWDRYLSEDELRQAAHNAHNFLQTPEGIQLGNFFVRTMAKASDYMWADDDMPRAKGQ